MDDFENMDWIEAVMSHPATEDTDLYVAVAMMLASRANGLTRPGPDGPVPLPQEAVDESVALLTQLGFVESVATVTVDGGEDHLLVLRMPVTA